MLQPPHPRLSPRPERQRHHRPHQRVEAVGLGPTDPVSGEMVVKLPPSTAAKKKPRGKAKAGKRKKRG